MKSGQFSLVVLLILSSCSWYRNLERSLVEDDANQKRSKIVSREQYDQLLVKYEELSKKYQDLKDGSKVEKSALVDELQKTTTENFANTSTTGDADTVDVFGSVEAGPAASVVQDVEGQLALFKKGVGLKSSNPGEATKIFQQLETEGIPSVKVRAKFEIGEMLFNKQQYDLSLQVFEDIINKYSHSGMVLGSLRYAKLCSEKLGLQSKKDQYSSMLTDVFEAQ